MILVLVGLHDLLAFVKIVGMNICCTKVITSE